MFTEEHKNKATSKISDHQEMREIKQPNYLRPTSSFRDAIAVERWGNKLNGIFQRPNSKIKELMNFFKTEAENSACMFIEIQLSLEGKTEN